MKKSTPLGKRAAFVFLPPIAALIVGLFLIIQSASAISDFGILQQRKLDRENQSPAAASLTDYFGPRFSIDFAESEYVLVNKHRPLANLSFAPEVVEIKSSGSLDNSRGLTLRKSAASALEQLANALSEQGLGKLFVNSAYRSYNYQSELFVSKTKQYGLSGALLRSAKAGYSEHQTGLAVDVSVPAQGCAIMECFGDTEAGKWLAENAWEFGFIIRYEKGTTPITGYSYEPWHLRFIGKEMAREYKAGGFRTLEEFWGLKPAPDYPIASSTSD